MKLFWKNKVIMTLCLILIMIFISNDSYGNYRRRHIRKKTYSTYLIFNQPEKGLFFYYMIYKTKKRSCKVFVNLEILIYDFLNDSCKLYSKSIEIKDFRQHFSRELYNFIKLLSFSHKLSKLPLLRKKVTDEEINNIYDQIFFIPKPSKIVKQNIIIGYDIFKFYRGIHSGGEFKYLNHNYGKTEEEYIKEGWIIERWIRKRFYTLGYAAVEELRRFDYKKFFELEGSFTEYPKDCCLFCREFNEEKEKNNL